MKHIKLIIFALSSLVVTIIAFLYYQQFPLMEAFEEKTYDWRFRTVRGIGNPDPRIGIITIDDHSLEKLGRFPWTRERFTELVSILDKAGTRSLLIDVLFPEDQNLEVDNDFATAIAEMDSVILAMAFEFNADGINTTVSIPALKNSARMNAHINVIPDSDGVIRWTPLLIPDEHRLVPSLGLAGAMEALGVTEFDPLPFEVTIGDISIPTDSDGFTLINYVGPPKSYPRYSFADILDGTVQKNELKDKILFLGATALGVYDMRVTPFSGNTPGVEIHANIADMILNRTFMVKDAVVTIIDLISIALLGLAAITITLFARNIVSLLLIVSSIFAYTWFTTQMFRNGYWLSLVYPVFSLTISFFITANLKFFFLDRKSKEIRTIFSSYLSGKVVEELISNPEFAKVGGDSREVTLMFVDIANYTTFSENHTPTEVVQTLNEYLAEMTQIIIESGGTLDKFLGDGIMAFWGAPLPQEDHAVRAIDSALKMADKMDELAQKWTDSGDTPLSFRIGINSGEVIVGNIGAVGKKMEYTAIGDNVNLAARLEALNKQYGTKIMLSGETVAMVGDRFTFREIDIVRVKGRSQAASIYGLCQQGSPLALDFTKAFSLFRTRDFSTAQTLFEELEEKYDDGPSKVMKLRCREYLREPPPANWDGVYTATSK